jgi:hypothetical protein
MQHKHIIISAILFVICLLETHAQHKSDEKNYNPLSNTNSSEIVITVIAAILTSATGGAVSTWIASKYFYREFESKRYSELNTAFRKRYGLNGIGLINGNWHYIIQTGGSPSNFYVGTCKIKMNKEIFQITDAKREGELIKFDYCPKNIDWSSTWGQVCHDGSLRFSYDVFPSRTDSLLVNCFSEIRKINLEEIVGYYYTNKIQTDCHHNIGKITFIKDSRKAQESFAFILQEKRNPIKIEDKKQPYKTIWEEAIIKYNSTL